MDCCKIILSNKNKKIEKEGYFNNDKYADSWKYYYIDGTLNTSTYYIDDNQVGYGYEYAPDGKLFRKSYVKDDVKLFDVFYDTLGNVIDSVHYKYGEQDIVLHFPDNNLIKKKFHLKNRV